MVLWEFGLDWSGTALRNPPRFLQVVVSDPGSQQFGRKFEPGQLAGRWKTQQKPPRINGLVYSNTTKKRCQKVSFLDVIHFSLFYFLRASWSMIMGYRIGIRKQTVWYLGYCPGLGQVAWRIRPEALAFPFWNTYFLHNFPAAFPWNRHQSIEATTQYTEGWDVHITGVNWGYSTRHNSVGTWWWLGCIPEIYCTLYTV